MNNTSKMFKDNKYRRTYYNLIKTRRELNRVKSEEEYFERHHIIPRSLGGNNSNENLVLLTPKEHFIAHLLLPKFTVGEGRSKMIRARWYMFSLAKKKGYKNSSNYSKFKHDFRQSMSGSSHPNYGKPMSDQCRNNFLMSRVGMKNTELHNEAISKANLGKPKSAEHRRKISKSKMGGKASEATKQKLSEMRKGKGNARFTGYYMSPFGKLESRSDIKIHTDLIPSNTLYNWCKNPDKTITTKSFKLSPYLKSLGSVVVHKTYREMGFYFIPC